MGTALSPMQRTGPLTDEEVPIALSVGDAVQLGASLQDIAENGGPSVGTVLSWLRRDKAFEQYYNECRKVSAYWFEDHSYHISRSLWRDRIRDPNLLRNGEQFQRRLEWMAKVRNPAVFGDKVQAQIMTPVTFITNLDIGGDSTPTELGHTYTVKAMVTRHVDATEVPDDAIAVIGADGEAVFTSAEGETPLPEAGPEDGAGLNAAPDRVRSAPPRSGPTEAPGGAAAEGSEVQGKKARGRSRRVPGMEPGKGPKAALAPPRAGKGSKPPAEEEEA